MQINLEKTETMLDGAATTLKKFKNTQSLGVVGSIKKVQDFVKIVSVSLDSTLSFDSHISPVSQSCHYHMRALKHIRSMLTVASANELVCG